jgi:DNA replication initiation complex subunit (GINS family)
MTDAEQKIDAHFFNLVLSLQVAAMQQMGKIASPVTGKVERNLDQAQASIDILGMLSEKTKNNLTDEEKELLDRILFELRMNFIEESKKPAEKAEGKGKDAESPKPESESTTEDKKEPEA